MRGVVWTGERLVVTDRLSVRAPGPGEVKVRVLASGVCHSDLNMMDAPGVPVPVVLGHEAGGVVAEVGPGVANVAVGDRVTVCSQTPCGECRECRRQATANCDHTWGMSPSQPFQWEGRPVFSFANVSSFAEEIVVQAGQVFPTHELPVEEAALIGCAVATGYCAASTLAQVRPGDRVAVIGVGGIGVNAIRGARLLGAERIVALDLNPDKAEAARRFGADDFLLVPRSGGAEAVAERLREAGPIDTVIECSGAPAALQGALQGVKRGGRIVPIGMTRPGASLELSLDRLMSGCEIVTTLQGGATPADFPHVVDLARRREIDVGAQITRVWPLAEIEDAIAALRAGAVTRAVLDHAA
jgi:S-(hydroxymethyl)glutathione dehydrogenase/alcohol dehydrogenase